MGLSREQTLPPDAVFCQRRDALDLLYSFAMRMQDTTWASTSKFVSETLRASATLSPGSAAKFLRDLYLEWPLLVMDFTRRNLTRDSDRLPAAWMQHQTDDLYLCGLWAANLPFELLWYVETSTQEIHRRMTEPYAPSWSWASVTGPVTYYRPYITQFGQRYPGYQDCEVDVHLSTLDLEKNLTSVTIVDVGVHPLTLNKHGPGHASIELSGHVLPVTNNQNQELWESTIITMEYFDPKQLEFKYDVCSEVPDILEEATSANTFVLLFVSITTKPEFGYIVGSQVACLLQRVEGSVPMFKRREIVLEAGDDRTWLNSVPKSNIVLV
jgi:hypothetical protein